MPNSITAKSAADLVRRQRDKRKASFTRQIEELRQQITNGPAELRQWLHMPVRRTVGHTYYQLGAGLWNPTTKQFEWKHSDDAIVALFLEGTRNELVSKEASLARFERNAPQEQLEKLEQLTESVTITVPYGNLPAISDWCDEQCGEGNWYMPPLHGRPAKIQLWFKDRQAALLFKLTFG